jgi:peptidoglycan/xylan/chitin deacetylase (PgdA/CDA1 family)
VPVVGALVLLLTLGLLSLAVLPVGTANAAQQGADRRPCRAGWVALTFDDGPDAQVTRRLVRILLRVRVPATFFMVGERVARAPGAARLVSRSGFQIANHSYRHADMRTQSSTQIIRTLGATQRELRRAGARPTRLMRPPYGAIDRRVARAIRRAGYQPVLWNSDSWDWSGGSPETIARRVLGSMESRTNIVLQHDGILNSPNSVAAVPRIVRRARALGYCFTELDDQGRLLVPTPEVSMRTFAGREGQSAAVELSLTHATAYDTSVTLTTHNLPARELPNIPDLIVAPAPVGGAIGGVDFTPYAARVVFPAGTTRRVIRLPVTPDEVDEPDEEFLVQLSAPSGLGIPATSANIGITDTRKPPAIAVDPATVREPDRGNAEARIRIRLGRLSGRAVRLTLLLEPRTADFRDVRATRVSVTIPAGDRSTDVVVPVRADRQRESDERMLVRLVDVEDAWVFRDRTTLLIREAFSDRAR